MIILDHLPILAKIFIKVKENINSNVHLFETRKKKHESRLHFKTLFSIMEHNHSKNEIMSVGVWVITLF